MKNKNFAYGLIVGGMLLELIFSLLRVSVPGLGYVTLAMLVYALFILYGNREENIPKGTVVGHSFSGIVLIAIGLFNFLFALGHAATAPLDTYPIESKVFGALGLIFTILGLYSFTKASQVK